MPRLAIPLLLGLTIALSACANRSETAYDYYTYSPSMPSVTFATTNSASLDDYDTETAPVNDPLEAWNRSWTRTNDFFLLHIVKPLHITYAKVVPKTFRSGISNFSHNLLTPVRMVNSMLQGEFGQAGVEFGRFIANTITSLGFADVAQKDRPYYRYRPETLNFGYTLAVIGIPEGPYFVIPFVGPSTVRNAFGRLGDVFLDPLGYVVPWQASLGSTLFRNFNDADTFISPYETLINASFEPYIAIRNWYLTTLPKP